MEIQKRKSKLLSAIFISLLTLLTIVPSVFALESERSTEIYLSVNGSPEFLTKTSKDSLEEILEEHGFNSKNAIIENDRKDSVILPKDTVRISTLKNIKFNNAGKEEIIHTYKDTVGEFLRENRISLSSDDIVRPSMESLLSKTEEVTFVDIEEEIIEKKSSIPFKKKIEYSQDMKVGEKKVTQNGSNGEKTKGQYNILSNGEIVRSFPAAEKVTLKAVPEITTIGTKKEIKKKLAFGEEIQHNNSKYRGNRKTIREGKPGEELIELKVIGDSSEVVSRRTLIKPTNRIVEIGTKERQVSSSASYSLRDLQFRGVINWRGYKFTYYSQSVLPGGGLRIPGRHINANGYVADKDGYIVLANDSPKGTVIATPFGAPGKVYDRGTYGNHYDVYTR